MKNITPIPILLVFFFGCTSSYPVLEPSSGNPKTKEQFTDNIRDGKVTVTFRNGKEVDAIHFRVGSDSCVWNDVRTGTVMIVQTKEINKVVSKNHLLGSLEGFGIGSIGGGFATALFASVFLPKGSGPESDMRGVGIVIYSVGGAVFGALVGTVCGAFSGHKDEYRLVWFSDSPPSKTNVIEQSKKK